MKKIILNFAAVLFVLSCFFITSCKKGLSSTTFSFEIVNAADINLKINSIEFGHTPWSWFGWSRASNYWTPHTVNKEIQKKSLTPTPSSLIINETIEYEYTNNESNPNCIKINCSYLTNSGTTAFPYAGTLDGEKVSIEMDDMKNKCKTTDLYFYYEEGIILNFVKTTDDDYVLCIVE